jgi:hypothetical protein
MARTNLQTVASPERQLEPSPEDQAKHPKRNHRLGKPYRFSHLSRRTH